MNLTVQTPVELPLSDSERRALDLYDRLHHLQLELAIIRVQESYAIGTQQTCDSLEDAQLHLLETRAAHSLRDRVVESVLVTLPCLNAVHGGTQASPVERDLLLHLEQRDTVAVQIAQQGTELQEVLHRLAETEIESLRVSRRNVYLASEVFALANKCERRGASSSGDREHDGETVRLEKELKVNRQRWKIIKATASAAVAGSGVDWTRDEILRDMVLDPSE